MRPYIICHMMASLDGRIDCDMTEQIDDTNHYYEALEALHCSSTLEGKNTLAKHYAQGSMWMDQSGEPHMSAGKQVYKAVDSDCWEVGVDTQGTLEWGDNTAEQFGKPLVMILSEWTSQAYLDYLKSKGISYIATGQWVRDEQDDLSGGFRSEVIGIDLKAAMEILHDEFGINRLAVVGGGHINGSMLDLGLIYEVSMMYGYGIDGREGQPAAFDGRPKKGKPVQLKFQSVQEQDGIVWLRYLV